MTTTQFPCANWNPDHTGCKKDAKYTCHGCFLVAYCGPQCQKSHWTAHKKDCKSDLGKKLWRPDWDIKNRTPAFVGNDVVNQELFGGKKYLWGNIPAFDIVNLGENEGNDYANPLRMLFAASGDLRNVVKSIAQLPDTYRQPLEVTLNDLDLDIVACNAIILLVAFSVENVNDAVDCILHIWYSALIRESDVEILRQKVRPLIEEVCGKTKGKAKDRILGKTWTFGERSLRLVLTKGSWDTLLAFVNGPEGLTAKRADEIRVAVTLAEQRKDYRDRHLVVLTPSWRIAKTRFRKDGLLLPFGSARDEFQHPNPTLFQSKDDWPMHDNADPLNGWDLGDIERTLSGPATSDVYGKLHYHLRGVLGSFLGRISDSEVSFRLLNVDALYLDGFVEKGSFSRVEVSNISDGGYFGIHRTLAHMAPLLEAPRVNQHATLITLFMNAVEESITEKERYASIKPNSETTRALAQYLPVKAQLSSRYDPQLVISLCAREIIGKYDSPFDRYAKLLKFTEAGDAFGAAVKEKHTVIEKWPFRLKLGPKQPGGQAEFDDCSAEGFPGRSVMWNGGGL